MSTLFQRSRRRSAERSVTTIDEYIQAVAEAASWGSIPGVTQTLPGQAAEPIPADFAGATRQMFGRSSVIFACMLARLSVFSSVRFQYQALRGGRPGQLFGDASLAILERPWKGGVTADLLARMITDADLAGNAYITVDRGELVRMRPDWVDIALEPRWVRGEDGERRSLGWRKLGYLYYEDGVRDGRGVVLLPDEVAHFAPIPDPLATYRGMSWLTPVIREMFADSAMTEHKTRFMRNAATPNMVIKHAPQVTAEQARKFKVALDTEYAGPENAGKTMHLGGGADLTVVGQSFKEIDLRQVQGALETRIAAAAGVPPIIVGLSEGLQAATYSNYGQARRRFADGTLHPLWGNASGSLERIRPAPTASRLWYDARDVPFLREDSKDAAEIARIQGSNVRQLVEAGFEPGSVVAAVTTGDMSLLVHTGRLSVQLQEPGQSLDGAAELAAGGQQGRLVAAPERIAIRGKHSFDPDQPRYPPGHPLAGQWVGDGPAGDAGGGDGDPDGGPGGPEDLGTDAAGRPIITGVEGGQGVLRPDLPTWDGYGGGGNTGLKRYKLNDKKFCETCGGKAQDAQMSDPKWDSGVSDWTKDGQPLYEPGYEPEACDEPYHDPADPDFEEDRAKSLLERAAPPLSRLEIARA